MGAVNQNPETGQSTGAAAALDQARLPNRCVPVDPHTQRYGQTPSGRPFGGIPGERRAGSSYNADDYEPLTVSGAFARFPLAVRVTTAVFLPVGLNAPNSASVRSVIAGTGAIFLEFGRA